MVREQAQKYHKSLNAQLLEALAMGLNATEGQITCRDMDYLAGTWVEDEAFDRAIAAFREVHEDLWK